MTGLERNSDIVVMAAYAPLLVNVNPGGMQWAPDLIGYDALRSYGSPSYYAQVIFASHLGDQTLGSKVESAGDRFFYSITRDSAKKRLYLKLVNSSSAPQAVEIEFTGAKLAATGTLISLSAKNIQATNTMEQPAEIVPVKTALHGVNSHLRHTMPRYSIQLIQVDEQ
jgi:alpha-N-arabinofuranosidase